MSSYITTANNVYAKLQEHEEDFLVEAEVINYAKCYLLQNNSLSDFITASTSVSVYENSKGYTLIYDDVSIDIEVSDRQIISLEIS